MNLQKCKNGHFYDGDLYTSCPHCGSQELEPNKTVALTPPVGDEEDKTMALSSALTEPETENLAGGGKTENDIKTISIFQDDRVETKDMTPTVGWLVCTNGKYFGRDFPLKSGRNFIGRARNMDICLEGEMSVSRERHATVIYEPRQNIFLVQPGDARELFYLDEQVVLSAKEIKKNGVLQVGEVTMMLIPCCDEKFKWNQNEKDG